MERDYKQKRLTQRVKNSPAIVNNDAAIAAMRESQLVQRQEEMLTNERDWD